ncbi:unnamed protein product [Mesocestoides corti]|uniref:Uncharacterized protein n=1 Tax=Mesocestoides corti TaxID=53468 RepID=A0A0R3UCI6_MESCO|nr:unnamed protein product [Mesocestoides corti]
MRLRHLPDQILVATLDAYLRWSSVQYDSRIVQAVDRCSPEVNAGQPDVAVWKIVVILVLSNWSRLNSTAWQRYHVTGVTWALNSAPRTESQSAQEFPVSIAAPENEPIREQDDRAEAKPSVQPPSLALVAGPKAIHGGSKIVAKT